MHPGKRFAAEAHTSEEALRLIGAGFDVIQLDKFSPDAVAAVVYASRASLPPPVIAAAGGIVVHNAAAYAAAGATSS